MTVEMVDQKAIFLHTEQRTENIIYKRWFNSDVTIQIRPNFNVRTLAYIASNIELSHDHLIYSVPVLFKSTCIRTCTQYF